MPVACSRAALLCAAAALPLLTLTVRGGPNASYFVLVLAALAAYAATPPARFAGPATAGRSDIWLIGALCLPALAVLSTELAHGAPSGRAFDPAARFLLAAVLLWLLQRTAGMDLRHLQWGVLAGAMLAPVLLLAAGADGASLRPQPEFASAITFGNIGLTLGVCAWLSLGWRLTAWPLEPAAKLLAGGAGVYASILSQSRGGWLALPVLLLLSILLWRIRWRRRMLVLACAAALLGGLYQYNEMVRSRIAQAVAEYHAAAGGPTGGGLDSSVGLRLEFWRAALDIFKASPATGIGSQNLGPAYRERAQAGLMSRAASGFSHVHNDYLQAMAANGLPGLLALLAIYLVPLSGFARAACSADPDKAVAARMGVATVVSFMVYGLTETMFAITMNASFYCGMLAVLWQIARRPGGTGSRAPAGLRA